MNSIKNVNMGGMLMTVYPNPANNNTTINIALPSPQEISLEMYDMKGRLVKDIAKEKASQGKHQYPVLLNDISAGMYYIKLVTATATCEQKIVVIK